MTMVTVDQDTGEIIDIDGELPEERALTVVREPVGLARASDPSDMIAMASKMATALKDIVERQKLFAVIQGKKYPTVEAWMTIARMDNVVAREAERPIRHEDGTYEAFAELVRLGDMAVIGKASAICGMPGDKPWDSRPEYARRSMASTRATSRAFRQQYSWIMSLAGYEPTPADEMPGHGDTSHAPIGSSPHRDVVAPPPAAVPPAAGGYRSRGVAERGRAPVDGELREGPDGSIFGFSLREPSQKRLQVMAREPIATALASLDDVIGAEVEVTGHLEMVRWQKDGKDMPPFRRLWLDSIKADAFTLPAVAAPSAAISHAGTTAEDEAELDALLA